MYGRFGYNFLELSDIWLNTDLRIRRQVQSVHMLEMKGFTLHYVAQFDSLCLLSGLVYEAVNTD